MVEAAMCDWQDGASSLTDEEVLLLIDSKHIPAYKLEKQLGDYERGVAIRYFIHTIIVAW